MVKKGAWSLAKLKDICGFIGRGTPSKEIEDFWCGNIPWISSSDLTESSIWKINITRHITPEAVTKSATQICPSNSILVVSRVGVGKVAIAPVEVCTSQDFTNLVCRKHDARFLAYYIQSKMKMMAEKTQGTSIKGVTVEDIAQIEIKLPPREEQTSIAVALSDIDSLISSLQKLIEKKRAIKQGAMQELLTGKKRLPGFRGEWEKGLLGDICDIVNGGTPATSISEFWHGKILWCIPTDITSCTTKYIYNTESKITESGLKSSSATLLPKGALLLCSRATIGEVRIAGNEICTNQGFKSLVAHESICNEWLYYMVHILRFKMMERAIGSTFLEISKKDLSELDIAVPTFPEQCAIAQVLSDMDDEIGQLEKKLAKCQQIKQGMMQELLTGRIRLVDEESHAQPKAQAVQEKRPQPAHNQHFDDAVMIAGIVNAFYSAKYPLGRKKVQKLLYLVRRKEQADTSAFHKKAAGPYADEVRYKGGEPIAQKNKYIQVKRSDKGSCFERGVQMQKALAYLQDWDKQADIDWLVSQFQYTKVNELELLATVDMAICDLRSDGKEVSVSAIKDLIGSNKEWRDKLKKDYFKDTDIRRAIERCKKLFPDKEG